MQKSEYFRNIHKSLILDREDIKVYQFAKYTKNCLADLVMRISSLGDSLLNITDRDNLNQKQHYLNDLQTLLKNIFEVLTHKNPNFEDFSSERFPLLI